jgi:hypothetical protein
MAFLDCTPRGTIVQTVVDPMNYFNKADPVAALSRRLGS